jgi:hypothetical protein
MAPLNPVDEETLIRVCPEEPGAEMTTGFTA